jgi:hypothetical protein
VTALTGGFKSNTGGNLSLSISSRSRNGETATVWDRLIRRFPSAMGQVLIALGSFTHLDQPESSGGASRVIFDSPASTTRRQRGVRITLRQARDLALRVMAEAERNTREERTREAFFLRGPVEEESYAP